MEPGRAWGRTACVVTGASRGLGRSLARLLAARLPPGSALLLVARSAGPLGQLEGELRAARPGLLVRGLPADLGSEEGLRRAAEAGRELREAGPLQRLLLLNNAGESPAGAACRSRRRSGLGGEPGAEPPPARLGLGSGGGVWGPRLSLGVGA